MLIQRKVRLFSAGGAALVLPRASRPSPVVAEARRFPFSPAMKLTCHVSHARCRCHVMPCARGHPVFTTAQCYTHLQTLAETAQAAGKSEAETAALLAACREKLFNVRANRPRPHRDDKVCRATPTCVSGYDASWSGCSAAPYLWCGATGMRRHGGVNSLLLHPKLIHTFSCSLLLQIVSAWQGMAISAFATAARVLPHEQPPAAREFPVKGRNPREYLDAALKVNLGWVYGHGGVEILEEGRTHRSALRQRSRCDV